MDTGDTDIYFVANPSARSVTTVASFRVGDKVPEFYFPDTGLIERPAVYDIHDNIARLPVHLAPAGSVFVVFRDQANSGHIVSAKRNGEPLLSMAMPKTDSQSDGSAVSNSFTLAGWVKPEDTTTLHAETNAGVRGIHESRNDVIYPPHGDTFSDAAKHAGAGLAVGSNGVCVFEHGGHYFAPVLVHAADLKDWTHVAVVYRDGQPSLFLDGKLVHTGLQSTYVVHPGNTASAGSDSFRGQMGSVVQFAEALDAAKIAELAKSTPIPVERSISLPINLVHDTNGKTIAVVWQAGDYTLEMSDGNTQQLNVPKLPEPVGVSGPWSVAFDLQQVDPASITMETLQDWTKHADPRVKHYSGQATYRTRFELPPPRIGHRYYLDLGEVQDLAVVRVNGKDLGTLWTAPWQVEITDAAKSGENLLEIDVVNTWNNRLVGDANLPSEQRQTYLASPTVRANSPLLPAGLIGPVKIRTAKEVEVSAGQ